jgi:hypothetical protein
MSTTAALQIVRARVSADWDNDTSIWPLISATKPLDGASGDTRGFEALGR